MGSSIEDSKQRSEFWDKVVGIVECALALALTFLVVILSLRILSEVPPPPHFLLNDLAALLFGSASLALFIFSSLITIIAVLGWNNIIKNVQEKVEASTEKKLQAVALEMRGRSYSNLGLLLGELSQTPGTFSFENSDRLALAVKICQAGYNILKDFSPGPRLMSLNNLVYYRSQKKDRGDYAYLLGKARELRAAGEENKIPCLLLTFCRVVVTFAEEVSESELEDASAILQSLIRKTGLEPSERKEAEYYRDLLRSRKAVQ